MPGRNLSRIIRLAILGIVVTVKFLTGNATGVGWLILGWIIGNLLVEVDHMFYVAVCSPQELSCQRVRFEVEKKNWRNAWGILQQTTHERTRLPIHNVLTAIVISILGIWLVTSNGSLLAVGGVIGLNLKLFLEFLSDPNYGKWYWIFGRQFTSLENRGLKIIWGGLLLLQIVFILRG